MTTASGVASLAWGASWMTHPTAGDVRGMFYLLSSTSALRAR
ncbi:hypothetical protein [Streptomyces beigongshangae]|nr:hypothetical protein [Streptomyces sp. REN17]